MGLAGVTEAVEQWGMGAGDRGTVGRWGWQGSGAGAVGLVFWPSRARTPQRGWGALLPPAPALPAALGGSQPQAWPWVPLGWGWAQGGGLEPPSSRCLVPSGCWSGWMRLSCAWLRSSSSGETWTWCSSSWQSSRWAQGGHWGRGAAGAGTEGVGQMGAQDGSGVEMWDGASAPTAPTHGGCWVAQSCPRRCLWKAQLLTGRSWGQEPVPGCAGLCQAVPCQSRPCCAVPKQTEFCHARPCHVASARPSSDTPCHAKPRGMCQISCATPCRAMPGAVAALTCSCCPTGVQAGALPVQGGRGEPAAPAWHRGHPGPAQRLPPALGPAGGGDGQPAGTWGLAGTAGGPGWVLPPWARGLWGWWHPSCQSDLPPARGESGCLGCHVGAGGVWCWVGAG